MFATIGIQCFVVPMLLAIPPSALGSRAGSPTLAPAAETAATDVSQSLPPVAPPTLNARIVDAVRSADPTDSPVSEPKKRHGAGRGALIGFLVGAGTGASIGFLSGDDRCNMSPSAEWLGAAICGVSFSANEKALLGGISLGVIGTAVGAVLGAANAHSQSRVTNTRHVRLDVGASVRHGVTATASLRF